MTAAIEIKNLKKTYEGGLEALKGIDLLSIIAANLLPVSTIVESMSNLNSPPTNVISIEAAFSLLPTIKFPNLIDRSSAAPDFEIP